MTYSQLRHSPPNTVPAARPTRSEVLAALPELVPPGASIYNQIEAANLIEATIRRWWPPEPASQSDGPAVPTGREPASVADEPSDDAELDEPLGDLIDKWCQEGMQVKPYGTQFPFAHYVASKAYQYGLSKSHQPTPPAEGELVAELEVAAVTVESEGGHHEAAAVRRAADLLAQRYPEPVPVAERPWEREGWCDGQARCWWGRQVSVDWYSDWTLATYEDVQNFSTYSPMTDCLPFHVLPLPAGR